MIVGIHSTTRILAVAKLGVEPRTSALPAALCARGENVAVARLLLPFEVELSTLALQREFWQWQSSESNPEPQRYQQPFVPMGGIEPPTYTL